MEDTEIRTKVERRRVSPKAWRAFERKIASLQIASWKSDYQPKDEIMDGYSWEFRWVSGSTRIESGGENAGPDPNDPARTLEGFSDLPSADTLLSHALDELWKCSKPMSSPGKDEPMGA
jgi:hypothetical protein